MKTKVRTFQRNFATMRAAADAGEPVEIIADGHPRYVFKLINLPERAAVTPPSLVELLRRATKGVDVKRDKSPLRPL